MGDVRGAVREHAWQTFAALAAIAAASLAPIPGAVAQDFGVRSMKPGFPEEKKPKIDEKAYKAALEKIPAPTAKYDPWSGAHAAEPARPGKTSN
jgi:hypothetical protein